MMYLPCIILARKNSKGLRYKNRVKFRNKPLIEHTINHAKNTKFISHVVISTDDKKIKEISEGLKCDVLYPRIKRLSNDKAKSEDAIKDALEWYEKKYKVKTKYYCYLQITEPLRPRKILEKCIQKIFKNKKLDSVFAAFETHKNYWQLNKNKKEYFLISSKKDRYLPRQIKEPVLREDSGVALVSKSSLIKNKLQRIGNRVSIVKYSSIHGVVDIHSKEDLKLAECISKIKN